MNVAMQMLKCFFNITTLLIAAIKPCPVVEGFYEPIENKYFNSGSPQKEIIF